jgi:thiosulfate/3-mercaptopyruvate sulfurtransferase
MSRSTDLGYARPDLLAEPDWLWEHRDDPGLRLIDCAAADAYGRAHIPGAVGLPVDVLIKEPEGALYRWAETMQGPPPIVHVTGPESFAAMMGGLGVADATTVVCYDDSVAGGDVLALATRLWWVLNYYGHTDAKVLNGGWHRWVAEGRPITYHEANPDPTQFTAAPNDAMICHLHYLLDRYADDDVQVINVLPEGWYLGTENPFHNKRPGHIPGSVNVPADRFLTDTDPPLFKSARELRELLNEAGLTPEKETIVHCQGGIDTTLCVFALSLLGWDRVRAYDASMSEWANRDDTPLTLGLIS